MRGDSYLPVLVRECLLEGSDEPTPWCRPVTGALLFVDVVGFTARTERFARSGREGVERLTRVLNQHFGHQIDVITRHGGDVVSFAGDALTAVWTADLDGDLSYACHRACRCALELQSSGPADPGARLPARAVVAAGDAFLTHLGGEGGRWLVSLLGPVLDQAMSCVKAATAGKVIVSSEVARLLGDDGLRVGPAGASAHTVVSTRFGPTPAPLLPPALDDARQPLTARYVSSVVTAWLDQVDAHWIGELRQGTAMFVSLPRWEPGEPGWLEQAHGLVGRLQNRVDHYEGIVDKIVIDDKGATLLVAFGLPPRAHEDAAARAVRCAMEIRGILDANGGAGGIGVATGPVYCGLVGSDVRREYTVIGSAVNVAARLMQKAGDGILCNAASRAAAPAHVDFAAQGTLEVKGIEGAIDVFVPERARVSHRREATTGFVGRQEELVLLREVMAGHASSPEGTVVLVEGEAGIGMSRLLGQLEEIGAEFGVRTLVGEANSVERRAPYHAWRLVLGELLELEFRDERAQLTSAVAAALAADPELLPLLPLVNDVLPVSLEETAFTNGLSDEARADNLQRLIGDLLSRAAASGPVAVVLDDAHWFDSASWALLRGLVEARPAIAFVVGTRPLNESAPPEWEHLLGHEGRRHLVLERLPPEALDALVAGVLGVDQLPSAVRALIHDKAQGNALFGEQLALALLDDGHVRVVDRRCEIATGSGGLREVVLPATVQGVVHGRLGRLSTDEQLLLKVASVLGRTLDLDLVSALSGREDSEELAAGLVGRGILERQPGVSGAIYEFRHNITRDAIYETQLFARRREIHSAAVSYYEEHYPDSLDTRYPLLVHHTTAAESWTRALVYLEKAGFQALERSANAECVDSLQRALAIAEREGIPSTGDQLAEWHWHIAEANYRLGRMDDCVKHGYPALQHLGMPMKRGGLGRLWKLFRLTMERNVRWVPRSFPQNDDEEVRRRRLRGLRLQNRMTDALGYRLDLVGLLYSSMRELFLANVLGQPGEAARATMMLYFVLTLTPLKGAVRSWIRRAVDLAEQEDDPAIRAVSFSRIAVARIQDEVDLDAGRVTVERALSEAHQVGDLKLEAEVAIGGAMIAWVGADWPGAVAMYGQVRDAARRAGDSQFTAFGAAGEAAVRVQMGELAEAERLLASAQATVDTLDEAGMAVVACGERARVAHLQGRDELARTWAIRTLERAEKEPILGVWWFRSGLNGMCEVLIDRWAAARAAGADDAEELGREARRAIKQSAKHGSSFAFSRPFARHHQARLQQILGRPDKAEALWLEVLAIGEQRGLRLAEVLALQGLAKLAGEDSQEGQERLQRAAAVEAAMRQGEPSEPEAATG